MARPPTHRLLARVLESDADIVGWTARHRRELALTRVVRRHLPRPLAERVHVSDARGDRLELAAGGGAIAAALRQRASVLRAALARDGYEFAEIGVRIDVAAQAHAEQKTSKRQWDSAEATPLFDLADALPEGPLRAALARWSRRARGR